VTWLRRPRGVAPRAFVGLALGLLAVAVAACGAGEAEPARPAGLVAIGAGLRGPQGLAASVYATGLPTASAFAVDDRGRLWVATSAASDHRHDGVYLVAHAGARPVKVIRGVRGPLGLTWYRGRLYVGSLGRVDAYSGLDGAHFTKRTTILTEPSGHGWNNSIVVAPNGRLVMSISSACDHCTSRSRWSATILSFRPDGSDVRVYAKGIRAGYGLAFYPGTSDLLVSMNQRDDLGAQTPGDWLAHVAQGDDWRFPACYGQGGAACAGVPTPIAVLDKHAAAGAVAPGTAPTPPQGPTRTSPPSSSARRLGRRHEAASPRPPPFWSRPPG
jgi:glucose/arabinose dehydrogenase